MTGIMQMIATNTPEGFITNGSLLYLDAGNSSSYAGSGTTWTDLSTNTNNATIAGSPTFTSSGTASYFTFNGAGTQYANTDTAKYNQTYAGKTVFIVARMNASSWTSGVDRYRCMFGTASGTRNFNTYMHQNSSNNLRIHWSANGVGGFSNNLSLSTNQWFVAAVTHTTGGLVSYYLNGQPAGTNTGQTFAQWFTNGGENVAYADNYWYGDISVVTVYKRALSGAEILQNYNAVKSRYGL